MPPALLEPLEDTEVLEGSAAKLGCKFAHASDATVTWYVDGEPLDLDDERCTVEFDGETCSLTIVETTLDDEGDYKCAVASRHGAASSTAELVIEEGLSLPVFSKRLQDLQTVEGETAQFDVSVGGQPEPVVEWFKDERQLEDQGRVVIVDDVDDDQPELFSLAIEDCRLVDTGIYKCIAMNEAGKVSCTCELVVLPNEGR